MTSKISLVVPEAEVVPKKEDIIVISEVNTSNHRVCRCCLNTTGGEEVSNMQDVYIGEVCSTVFYEDLTKIKVDLDNIPATICNCCTKEFIKINEFISMLKNSFYTYYTSFYTSMQTKVEVEEDGEQEKLNDQCEVENSEVDGDFTEIYVDEGGSNNSASESSDDDIPLSQKFEIVFQKPVNEKKVRKESNAPNNKLRVKRGRKVRAEEKCKKENDLNDWFEQKDLNFEDHLDDKSTEMEEAFMNFQCSKCKNTTFHNYKDIEKHAKAMHSEESSCIICSQDLANPFALLYHMMVKHGKLKCCRLCLVSFKNSKEQMEHYKSVEHNTKCNVCGQQFKKRKALYEHRRKKHLKPEPQNQKYKCPECSKEFTNRNNIKRHVMVSHCDVRFLCDTCGQSYTTKRNLRLHIQKFHEGVPVAKKTPKKNFFCDVCGKELKIFHKYAIALHRAKHKGHSHVCKRCYDSFETEKQLKEHIVDLKHDLFECDKCPAQFVMVENFKAHMKNHEAPGWNKNMFATWGKSAKLRNEKGEFVCSYCPKVFKDKQRLDNHVRVHTNERPYACHICGKSFKTWIHRKTHLNIHLGIKKWVCKFCSKAFTNSCTLKGHEMIHTGERPHPCPDCKKGFITVSAMKRHRMVHLTNGENSEHLKKEKSSLKNDRMKDSLKEENTEEQEDEPEEETLVIAQTNQDLMFKYGQIFSGNDMSYESVTESNESAKDASLA